MTLTGIWCLRKLRSVPLSDIPPDQTANLYYEGEVGGRVSVNSPRLWSAEDPYLYTAVIALYDGEGNLLDVTNQKIGIRSLSLASDDEGNQTLTINGERIVLYGINYNEHDPETGMTLSYEQMLSDVKLMKELNINAVRSPGRSLSTTFLDLCDQYGYLCRGRRFCFKLSVFEYGRTVYSGRSVHLADSDSRSSYKRYGKR